ncbi:MAG TPA: magnesium-transporting ATPase, partial [Propionibacteriaceae bacterium]|nr:magnesium-transporting ATPase [Propionibacteriaceae bacterium]
YAAQLAAEASKFTMVKSELQQGINKILKLITYLMIPVGILTIWVQLTQVKGDWREAILRTAGALVPMVPEGLVLLTSLAFAVGIIRLGQRQCLVQEMPALEGLARVDVVCADKTGTLTENGMALAETLPLGDTGANYSELLSQLVASDPRPNGSVLAIKAAVPQATTPWSVAALAPFTSAKKWSGVSFADHGNIILGAPDVLAAPGSAAGVQAQEIASTGRRVLLLGQSDLRVDDPQAPGTLTPLALLVLDQKIRPDARETLEYFGDQDVAVKVISGDNAAAVGAVTRSLGVTSGDAVDARTLKKDDDTAFADEIENNQVFGRVTPHQKRQMVKALQSRGHTVAMTGDGVNDVLALKDADLGVAMGSGSPATRAVAQIVLLDDKFATLPYVVKEGRQVIGNIERVANMFLTKTVYSILLALLVGLWQLPFPFQPIHISLIGWFTIGIPSSIMALAPNTERVRSG